jgi:pimeloyl-ACP methyl ester carboxylesterase
MENKETKNYPIAYFGASTGAASAIRAAAYFGKKIKAVVSRGGRPDLALNVMNLVTAPTLLIVGQRDVSVIEMNKKAFDLLISEKEMKIIPGATHLFEEPGKLIEVADLAILWYKKHLNKN